MHDDNFFESGSLHSGIEYPNDPMARHRPRTRNVWIDIRLMREKYYMSDSWLKLRNQQETGRLNIMNAMLNPPDYFDNTHLNQAEQ